MNFTLINQKTKEKIGEINLQFLPNVNDIIEFQKNEYFLVSVCHSESEIKLNVTEYTNKGKVNFGAPSIYP